MIGIDGNKNRTDIRVDEILLRSFLQIHHHGRDVHVVETDQIIHDVTNAIALEFNELGGRLVDDFVLQSDWVSVKTLKKNLKGSYKE